MRARMQSQLPVGVYRDAFAPEEYHVVQELLTSHVAIHTAWLLISLQNTTRCVTVIGLTVQLHMDTLRAVVFTTLFFLALPGASNASEDSEEGHKTHLETSAIWGYSFLFNFLGCLPSAFCVIVCLWAKLRIAEKVVTNLMAFASGVSIDHYYKLQQTNNATTGPHWRNTFPSFEGYCRRFF